MTSPTASATTMRSASPMGLEALQDHGVRHPAALAHRLHAVAATGALELAEQRARDASAGYAERVTERDGFAVHVDPAHFGVHLVLPRQDDDRERLVDLDEVHVVEGELRPLEHLG